MEEYIGSTLTKLKTKQYSELTIVIGNESCDLDSAVSCLVFANFLYWQHNEMKCKVCTKEYRDGSVDYKDEIFLPILNVDRNDFPLKTEVAFLFREKGINVGDLVYRDDYDLPQLLKSTKSKVVLVDHHVLANKDSFLAEYVTEIIDHRPIDKSGWAYKPDTRTTIETVGSCCTLVAQRIKDLSSLMAKDVQYFNAYPVCSEMLHATIILDTVNFSKEVNKGTPHDEEMTLFLENLLKPTDCKAEREKQLTTLLAARTDVSQLSAAQLLRKDVKIVGNVLVPSFPILVEEFLNRPEALKAVSEALTQTNCDVALLLGMDLSEGLKRDIAVFSNSNPQKAVLLSKFLEDYTSPPLGLSPHQLATPECRYYRQRNLSASRKQYIPALHRFRAVL
ncbi:exopolyphosphatase PRUNE1 isoform X1 [Spodoptera frugiperda]|uniref:Exopolyphosphatase PRUNE1 isoform X1 n=2 Tax=Spodoptera frugiperda TaxID=7108 RepID=A0A9R0E0T1_SPOFR|nr:exopolyphosphatase PRUNE1 isoform X1 [Spodoptera frugiperda]XP_050556711.1 exopolyphosphatase PRUNE1 isoform X1 [Spodoptera frugiperda]